MLTKKNRSYIENQIYDFVMKHQIATKFCGGGLGGYYYHDYKDIPTAIMDLHSSADKLKEQNEYLNMNIDRLENRLALQEMVINALMEKLGYKYEHKNETIDKIEIIKTK